MCKGKYDFIALMSSIAEVTHTWKVFAYKNVNSKWVAKVVVDKLIPINNVNLSEITNYGMAPLK